MKYIITESQIDGAVSVYLDNQDFIQVNFDEKIYFINSVNDVYSQIRFDKKYGWCYIDYELIEEISTFFSMDEDDSESLIGRWVGNTLQMKVTKPPPSNWRSSNGWLRLPYYN